MAVTFDLLPLSCEAGRIILQTSGSISASDRNREKNVALNPAGCTNLLTKLVEVNLELIDSLAIRSKVVR